MSLGPTDELAQVELALCRLEEKRASLQASIHAGRILSSPISQIDDDVLLEIFYACLPLAHGALIDPGEAPMLLGRICQHWRNIAYSASKLWSSFHIPSLLPSDHGDAPHVPRLCASSTNPAALREMTWRLADIVEAWLTRSGECPLSISLALDDLSFVFNSDPLLYFPVAEKHPLISLILKVSLRLRHLSLFGNTPQLQPLIHLGAENLPVLQSLVIRNTSHAFSRFKHEPVFQIPTLRHVSIHIVLDPISLPLGWSNLTELNLRCDSGWADNGLEGGLDSRGVLDIFRKCPNLVWCQITATLEPVRTAVNDTGLIILPSLRTLILGGYCFDPAHILCLGLPRLRHLQFGEWVSEQPSRDLNPSSVTAAIDPGQFQTSELVELLRRLSTITHLQLKTKGVYTTASMDDAFLALFHAPHQVLCPMLTHITVVTPWPGAFSDAAALAFVKARMTMPCPLRQFKGHFNRSMVVDIMPELQPFISGGLRVDIEYSIPQWKLEPREGLLDTFLRSPHEAHRHLGLYS
ncbi:hypothetical protein DFH06DRAFT_1483562 [Mycena polygramma]|nr:hypothetical protein DFH06DRAFT_1483562 [Mycena polygramma]